MGTGGLGGNGGADAITNSVFVHSGDAPFPNVAIVVNDSEGTVVTRGQTDEKGKLDVAVPEGGSVSVFTAHDLSHLVNTVVAPPAGLPLNFSAYNPNAVKQEPPAPTTYKIAPTSYPPKTTHIYLKYNCSSGTHNVGQPITVEIDACGSLNAHDFVFINRSDH